MRIIAKLLLLSLEEDEEVVLNAVMSALGSFENKTQLKEEIACEKLAFAGMEIDASKRLVHFALFGGRKCVLERSLCGA